MQLIIETTTSKVKYAYSSDYTIDITDTGTTVYNIEAVPAIFILDMTTDTAHSVLVDTLPTDETIDTFKGDKYLYNGSEWTLNPDYILE